MIMYGRSNFDFPLVYTRSNGLPGDFDKSRGIHLSRILRNRGAAIKKGNIKPLHIWYQAAQSSK
jgi:hypothetical protein